MCENKGTAALKSRLKQEVIGKIVIIEDIESLISILYKQYVVSKKDSVKKTHIYSASMKSYQYPNSNILENI